MATRSMILVSGTEKYRGTETIRLYKHSDGYPTDVLHVLNEALEQATSQVSPHNAKWNNINGSGDREITASQLVGKIIGAATTEYGMGALMGETWNGEFNVSMLGNQWDVEWMYIVDVDKKSVSIYRGSFKSGPQAGYKNGTVDPTTYADQLKAEFQDDERNEIAKLVRYISAWGFKVNPPQRKNRKSKPEMKPVL